MPRKGRQCSGLWIFLALHAFPLAKRNKIISFLSEIDDENIKKNLMFYIKNVLMKKIKLVI